ncbi:hypothetical protein ACNOYE_13250 [Nannocystaceae bacterium ST9]
MPLTIEDMLRRVETAADADEARRHLFDASAAIEGCHDARRVLQAAEQVPTLAEAELRELIDRTLTLALVEREVWGIRDAASALAGRLGDPDAAQAALVRGERAFAAEGVFGYVWVLLARGFAETLADLEGVERCLIAGRAQAERDGDLDDRCGVASAWAELIDCEQGRAQLELVEAASTEVRAAWSLANAWNALDDHVAARRVLDRALEHASSSEDSLTIARAWASHQLPGDALRAFARAEAQAQSFAEWFELADTATSIGLGEPAIRRALEQAEVRAGDADERMQLANAYAIWLHDFDAAERIGPRGLRPEALRELRCELDDASGGSGWSGSGSRLFDELRARASEAMLRRIAGADYGSDFAQHFAALTELCASGLLPRQMRWHPGEVLALTRWSQGEQTDHLERALACALLCIVPGDADELATSGAILLESCLALGEPFRSACVELFVWRAEACEEGLDLPARLLILIGQAAITPDDPRLPALAETIGTRWIEDIGGSMREGLWRELIARWLPRELEAVISGGGAQA